MSAFSGVRILLLWWRGWKYCENCKNVTETGSEQKPIFCFYFFIDV